MPDNTTNEPSQEIPYGFCHCGCGRKTGIHKGHDPRRNRIKGEPYLYVKGHNSKKPLSIRFWNKVEKSSPRNCWEWIGSLSSGYGAIHYKGRRFLAHRLSWMLHNGPIPDELYVLHK